LTRIKRAVSVRSAQAGAPPGEVIRAPDPRLPAGPPHPAVTLSAALI